MQFEIGPSLRSGPDLSANLPHSHPNSNCLCSHRGIRTLKTRDLSARCLPITSHGQNMQFEFGPSFRSGPGLSADPPHSHPNSNCLCSAKGIRTPISRFVAWRPVRWTIALNWSHRLDSNQRTRPSEGREGTNSSTARFICQRSSTGQSRTAIFSFARWSSSV